MESFWKSLRSFLGTALVVVAVLLVFTPLSRFGGYMEAKVRSDVSQARAHQREMAQMLEIYWNEHGCWPSRVAAGDAPPRFENVEEFFGMADPFREGKPIVGFFEGEGFLLLSAGPDKDFDIHAPWEHYAPRDSAKHLALLAGPWTYDPTNGTVSNGDVWRIRETPP